MNEQTTYEIIIDYLEIIGYLLRAVLELFYPVIILIVILIIIDYIIKKKSE